MGDGTEENQGVAKERARADAKRAASEQACTFIESISEIKNNNLTRDEIYTISAIILKVISDPVNLEISGGSVMFRCHITAVVDTSNVEKFLQDRQKLNEATRQNNELRAENERLQFEINNLNKKFAAASAEEKKEIKAEIKRNEEQFTAIQWIEKGDGYYREAIVHYLDALWVDLFEDLATTTEKSTPPSENYDAAIENYNKAIECYHKAIKLNPNNGYVYEELGDAHKSLGECYYRKTIEYLNKMIKLNPNNDYDWYIMGNVYIDIRQYNKAIECYDKALELNPKNRLYRHFKRTK